MNGRNDHPYFTSKKTNLSTVTQIEEILIQFSQDQGLSSFHSSPPPLQQPFVALTCIDPSKPLRIPFLLPASITSLEKSSGSLLPTVCQGTFSYSSCACIIPVLRGPLISGFRIWGANKSAYLGLSLFCEFPSYLTFQRPKPSSLLSPAASGSPFCHHSLILL